MTTEEFFKSLIGLTVEEATQLLPNDPKGAQLIEDEATIFKLGKCPNRIRVALQRHRRTDRWLIVKVYGRG